MNKTFRGTIQEDEQIKIRLSTKDGLTGYKIAKLQGMPMDTMGSSNTANEAILSVWAVEPGYVPGSSGTNYVNFDAPTLLGVFYFLRDQGVVAVTSETIIIDDKKFNQDIFILYGDSQTNNVGFNYYLELEQVKLDLSEATVATLRDMRGNYTNQDP